MWLKLVLFVCFYAVLSSCNENKDGPKVLDKGMHYVRILDWVISMRQYETFAKQTEEYAEKIKGEKIKGPKFLHPSDLEDFDLISGSKDAADEYPLGDATLKLDSNVGDASRACIGKKCDKVITQVRGMFLPGGLVSGPVEITFDDGNQLLATAVRSVFHGPYYEKKFNVKKHEMGTFQHGKKATLHWLFDMVYEIALMNSPTGDLSFTADNGICLFRLKPPKRMHMSMCGKFERGQVRNVTQYWQFKKEQQKDAVFRVSPVLSPSDPDLAPQVFSKSYFAAPNIDGILADTLEAQGLWLWFARRAKRDVESVFMDYPKVKSLADVKDLEDTVKMDTVVSQGPIKCKNNGQLDLYFLPKGTVYEHAALSYPGSGSKWIFELVQYTTGIKDYALWLEHENVYVQNNALLIKSHHQRAARFQKVLFHNYRESELLTWRLNHILMFGGRALLLIRNPYDAAVSYWNHAQAGEFDVNGNIIDELKTEEFHKFAMIEIELWFEIICDWVTISSPELVHVISFETFKKDPRQGLLEVMQFWRFPYSETRLDCVGKEVNVTRHERVVKTIVPPGHYRQELYNRFDEIIRLASDMLQRYGHKELPLEDYKHYGQGKSATNKDEL